jgi:hypothetical protein
MRSYWLRGIHKDIPLPKYSATTCTPLGTGGDCREAATSTPGRGCEGSAEGSEIHLPAAPPALHLPAAPPARSFLSRARARIEGWDIELC